MNIVSLFSGCGGLDLGFKKAGFQIAWANEFDKTIWDTFRFNFPNTPLETRDIRNILSNEIPDNIHGIIGGPPCQSFSEAGKRLGQEDQRGQLFLDYIRIVRDKKPMFFVAENVSGMLHSKHKNFVDFIVDSFEKIGYNISFQLLNAHDYDVAQDRKRVVFVGYRKDITTKVFKIDPVVNKKNNILKDVIWDLNDKAVPALDKNKANKNLKIFNHEYMTGFFSTIFMSRNRVRGWDEPSFTIQAGGRHAPIHPQAPKMIKIEKDKQIFKQGYEDLYRRLSVRECARIQSFPDDFIFKYIDVATGYKMIGNAVPVNLGYHIAMQIKRDLNI
ncbi:MAG: DNA cytosine methyltransferase [Spirochaetota bacterium]|nr:DNA cytosine methyltransferase [Spirochaetota bacterium]